MFEGKCIGKIIYTQARARQYTSASINSTVKPSSSSITTTTTILFIIRRRCLILLVRLNEYLIGSEVGKGSHTLSNCHLFFGCAARVSIFAFLLVDGGFLFTDMDYIYPIRIHCSLSLRISLNFSLYCDKYCQCRANTSEGMQNCFVSLYCAKNRRTDFCIFTTDHVMLSSFACIMFSRSPCAFWTKQKNKQTLLTFVLFIYFHRLFFIFHILIRCLALSLSLPQPMLYQLV